MKIGFYFKNKKYCNIDFSHPQDGNPGVGGVEYMFSLLSYYLAERENVYLFANEIDNLSSKTTNIKIDCLEDALIKAESFQIDYLICRNFGNMDDYKLLDKHAIKVIIWGHNFSKLKELNYIYKCKNVVQYVCVGKSQYQLLDGHPVYKKSTYIYNGLPLKAFVNKTACADKEICYIGSIIKGKGFAECCHVWRKLYDNGYKVVFNIIGSAKLYNSSKNLGKYGIATPEYEKEFIKYITDDNGKIFDEINFCGVLGHDEKIDIIGKSYFGLSASHEETFGLIAIECETLGKPFIAMTTCGYRDTVVNDKTGFLVNSVDKLYDTCLKVLTMDDESYNQLSANCIKYSKKFDIELIVNDWEKLLLGLAESKDLLNRKEKISLFNKIRNLYNLITNKR